MRISDWSSDVCSSDLWLQLLRHRRIESRRVRHHAQSLRCRLARPAAVGEARHRGAGGGGRMKIRAQIGKVLNLDKCIGRSEEHTSELQSLMRISYAVFCLQNKKQNKTTQSIKHK